MNKPPKIILVIVEGPSDQVALSFLNGLAQNTEFKFKLIDGDITSDRENSPSDILSKINGEVKGYIGSYGLKQKDVAGIIHIVDTDGTFIPDDCIVEGTPSLDPFYDSDVIRTSHVNRIRKRNFKKQANIRKLIPRDKIDRLPYRIFFMSSNLEHVLLGEQNCPDSEKGSKASNFSDDHEGSERALAEELINGPFSSVLDYKASWEFIQKDTNSLHRLTNLTVFLSAFLESVDNPSGGGVFDLIKYH